jgi:hypothetical protein
MAKRSKDGEDGALKDGRSYERTPTAITVVENTAIQQAIDFFNEEFFTGELPDVFVRYETRANSDGFYTPSGFSARDGSYEKDCIALNSDRFVGKTQSADPRRPFSSVVPSRAVSPRLRAGAPLPR